MAGEFKIRNGVIVNDTIPISGIIDDETLSTNLSTNLVSERAIKGYVDSTRYSIPGEIGEIVVSNGDDTATGQDIIIYDGSIIRPASTSNQTMTIANLNGLLELQGSSDATTNGVAVIHIPIHQYDVVNKAYVDTEIITNSGYWSVDGSNRLYPTIDYTRTDIGFDGAINFGGKLNIKGGAGSTPTGDLVVAGSDITDANGSYSETSVGSNVWKHDSNEYYVKMIGDWNWVATSTNDDVWGNVIAYKTSALTTPNGSYLGYNSHDPITVSSVGGEITSIYSDALACDGSVYVSDSIKTEKSFNVGEDYLLGKAADGTPFLSTINTPTDNSWIVADHDIQLAEFRTAGKLTLPQCDILTILEPRDVTTKEYVDDTISGAISNKVLATPSDKVPGYIIDKIKDGRGIVQSGDIDPFDNEWRVLSIDDDYVSQQSGVLHLGGINGRWVPTNLKVESTATEDIIVGAVDQHLELSSAGDLHMNIDNDNSGGANDRFVITAGDEDSTFETLLEVRLDKTIIAPNLSGHIISPNSLVDKSYVDNIGNQTLQSVTDNGNTTNNEIIINISGSDVALKETGLDVYSGTATFGWVGNSTFGIEYQASRVMTFMSGGGVTLSSPFTGMDTSAIGTAAGSVLISKDYADVNYNGSAQNIQQVLDTGNVTTTFMKIGDDPSVAQMTYSNNSITQEGAPLFITNNSYGISLSAPSSQHITISHDPTEDNDIANKRYVDNNVGTTPSLQDVVDISGDVNDKYMYLLDTSVNDYVRIEGTFVQAGGTSNVTDSRYHVRVEKKQIEFSIDAGNGSSHINNIELVNVPGSHAEMCLKYSANADLENDRAILTKGYLDTSHIMSKAITIPAPVNGEKLVMWCPNNVFDIDIIGASTIAFNPDGTAVTGNVTCNIGNATQNAFTSDLQAGANDAYTTADGTRVYSEPILAKIVTNTLNTGAYLNITVYYKNRQSS